MTKRTVAEKKILISASQLAEMFCFYPQHIDEKMLLHGQTIAQIFESGAASHAYFASKEVCIDVIQDAILDFSSNVPILATHGIAMTERFGHMKKEVIDVGSASNRNTILAIVMKESYRKMVRLSDLEQPEVDAAIYILIHYWSKCLRRAYGL